MVSIKLGLLNRACVKICVKMSDKEHEPYQCSGQLYSKIIIIMVLVNRFGPTVCCKYLFVFTRYKQVNFP